jgi:hypothetical protein
VNTISHIKGLKGCEHKGETWGIALANVLTCLGVAASIPEEVQIVNSVMLGDAVWHRGHLLTGWSA